LFVACFQVIFKFVVDSTTKKPRETRFFFGHRHGLYSRAHRISGLPKKVTDTLKAARIEIGYVGKLAKQEIPCARQIFFKRNTILVKIEKMMSTY